MAILEHLKKQIEHLVLGQQDLFSNAENELTTAPKIIFSENKNSVKSFEEVYKTSYSHGLEDIYALETVDIKSIRRIHEIVPENITKIKQPPPLTRSDQFEFDFGNAYLGVIDSFIPLEPIQVLNLSNLVSRILISQGKTILQDLLSMEIKDFVLLKGMGQGHIDEIQQKLKAYINERPLSKCDYVDFTSFLKTLSKGIEPKKNAVFLESFKLSSLFKLSAAETMEIKILSPERKKEWAREVLEEYQSEDKKKHLYSQLKEITEVFLKPWMRSRCGLASKEELLERILNVSADRDQAALVLQFLSECYQLEFLFHPFLIPVESHLYCCDTNCEQNYRIIIQKIFSYFYHSDITYSFKYFVSQIQKEFAIDWIGFEKEFIQKVLKTSSIFRVRKNSNHEAYVHILLS